MVCTGWMYGHLESKYHAGKDLVGARGEGERKAYERENDVLEVGVRLGPVNLKGRRFR